MNTSTHAVITYHEPPRSGLGRGYVLPTWRQDVPHDAEPRIVVVRKTDIMRIVASEPGWCVVVVACDPKPRSYCVREDAITLALGWGIL